jgi:hypothetical protein
MTVPSYFSSECITSCSSHPFSSCIPNTVSAPPSSVSLVVITSHRGLFDAAAALLGEQTAAVTAHVGESFLAAIILAKATPVGRAGAGVEAGAAGDNFGRVGSGLGRGRGGESRESQGGENDEEVGLHLEG